MSRQTSLLIASIVLLATFGTIESLRAQELFPQVNPPLLVPESKEPKSSPFSDDVESLKAPEKSDEVRNSAGSLNNLFSHQWVQTNGTGAIKGSVVTLSGDDTLSVSGTRVILAQKGRSIANTTSNQDGEFSFENVSPGYYSIIAEADNSFATYGLAVLSKDSGAHLPNSIEIRVIRPKGDAIRKIIGTDLPPTAISGTNDGMVSDPLATKRNYAKSHRILSSVDGKVVGRLSTMGMAPDLVDMSQMKTMLLRDGIEIGRSNVTADGSFSFENVEPGCYGLVAAGNRGVAAVAFCVLKPSEASAIQKSSDGKVFVMAYGSLQDTASPSLNVELADGSDVMNVQEQTKADKDKLADEDSPFVAPAIVGHGPGAGQVIGGGGGGGLGGGLGGLGGLGGIGGIGALGALAAIVADDNDNNTVVSPVTTTTSN